MIQTPLTQVEPESLTELMDRDPDNLTQENIIQMTEALRESRREWESDETTARNKDKRTPSQKNPLGSDPSMSAAEILAKMGITKE